MCTGDASIPSNTNASYLWDSTLAAPLPPRIIEQSLVSDRVVIDAVVNKYADHCPLYRQSAMPERDSGLELSRRTLDGWAMRLGELLVPLA